MSDPDSSEQASEAELAAIACQLRATLPLVVNAPRSPDLAQAPSASRTHPAAMLRFVGGFVIPGVLLIAITLVVAAIK